MSGVEVLRTERLILRHIDENDAPFLLELLNSPGFVANIGDRGVRTLDDARRYILEGPVESYRRHGFGLWLASVGDEPVGVCGLIKRDVLEHVDIGYALLAPHWGKGYAAEVAAAVLDHAQRVIGLDKVVAIVTPSNAGSIRVLEKIGLTFEKMIVLPGQTAETAYFTT